jgi:hypothetical protein
MNDLLTFLCAIIMVVIIIGGLLYLSGVALTYNFLRHHRQSFWSAVSLSLTWPLFWVFFLTCFIPLGLLGLFSWQKPSSKN